MVREYTRRVGSRRAMNKVIVYRQRVLEHKIRGVMSLESERDELEGIWGGRSSI